MRKRLRKRRGILLIEMIAVISLLAVFMVVISGLFAASIRAERDSVRTDERIHRADAAMGTLRRDVWAAGDVAVRDGHLVLTTDQDETVWAFQPNGNVVRTAKQSQHWDGLAAATVEVRGPLVTVTFAGADPQTIVFASQVMLAERKP